jgi:hypothetical protein
MVNIWRKGGNGLANFISKTESFNALKQESEKVESFIAYHVKIVNI